MRNFLTWHKARDWCNQFGCTLARADIDSYRVNFKGAHESASELAGSLADAVRIAARKNAERIAAIAKGVR